MKRIGIYVNQDWCTKEYRKYWRQKAHKQTKYVYQCQNWETSAWQRQTIRKMERIYLGTWWSWWCAWNHLMNMYIYVWRSGKTAEKTHFDIPRYGMLKGNFGPDINFEVLTFSNSPFIFVEFTQIFFNKINYKYFK